MLNYPIDVVFLSHGRCYSYSSPIIGHCMPVLGLFLFPIKPKNFERMVKRIMEEIKKAIQEGVT